MHANTFLSRMIDRQFRDVGLDLWASFPDQCRYVGSAKEVFGRSCVYGVRTDRALLQEIMQEMANRSGRRWKMEGLVGVVYFR